MDAEEAHAAGQRAFRAGRIEEARGAFERAAGQASGTDAAIRVESLAMLARCDGLLGQLESGARWLELAEAEADPSEPRGWTRSRLVRGLYLREVARNNPDAAGRALAVFEDVYRYALERGMRRDALEAAQLCALTGTPSQQVVWARRGLELAESLQDERMQAVLCSQLGDAQGRLERPQDALRAHLRARTLHRRTGGPLEQVVADWAVAHALRLSGDLDQAQAELDGARSSCEVLAEEDPDGFSTWLGYCWMEQCELDLARGAGASAAESLSQAAQRVPAPQLRALARRVAAALEGG